MGGEDEREVRSMAERKEMLRKKGDGRNICKQARRED